MTYNDNEKGMP